MKIFSSVQIKKWDAFTIAEQQIASGDLMERAAIACYKWLVQNDLTQRIRIFCGICEEYRTTVHCCEKDCFVFVHTSEVDALVRAACGPVPLFATRPADDIGGGNWP